MSTTSGTVFNGNTLKQDYNGLSFSKKSGIISGAVWDDANEAYNILKQTAKKSPNALTALACSALAFLLLPTDPPVLFAPSIIALCAASFLIKNLQLGDKYAQGASMTFNYAALFPKFLDMTAGKLLNALGAKCQFAKNDFIDWNKLLERHQEKTRKKLDQLKEKGKSHEHSVEENGLMIWDMNLRNRGVLIMQGIGGMIMTLVNFSVILGCAMFVTTCKLIDLNSEMTVDKAISPIIKSFEDMKDFGKDLLRLGNGKSDPDKTISATAHASL